MNSSIRPRKHLIIALLILTIFVSSESCIDTSTDQKIHYFSTLSPFKGYNWYHDDLDWERLKNSIQYSFDVYKVDEQAYSVTLNNSRFKKAFSNGERSHFDCNSKKEIVSQKFHLLAIDRNI